MGLEKASRVLEDDSTDDDGDLEDDELYRMYLNGETPAQMEHAYAIKRAGGVSLDPADGNDTSHSLIWEIDDSKCAHLTDWYVLITTILWLGPKILVMAIPMLLFHIMPMLICRLYITFYPSGSDFVIRNWAFYCAFAIALFWALPAILLIFMSLFLDYVFYYFFSFAFCFCTCRFAKAQEGFNKIMPYRGGPSILLHLPDFFVCVMGQCARQTVGETHYMVACMWLLMPWLKYYVNCNPYIYDLDSRFVQQVSTSMKDCGSVDQIADTSRRVISQAKHVVDVAQRVDLWSFVPHYPYPPEWRRWALGLQAGGAQYPGKFTLMVHTTHAVSEVDGISEQVVLSNSVAKPVYRVMLWYSNPFHFLTGWVEASITNGQPSQPEKLHGGEHPMWLVTGHTPMIAGRDGFTGSGMIDAFFDYWLPAFVHECRRESYLDRFAGQPDAHERALQIADDYYQEVGWDDTEAISKPRLEMGRKSYARTDVLSDYEKVGARQRKEETQFLTQKINHVGDTEIGRKINSLQQSDIPTRWISMTSRGVPHSYPSQPM